jgi:hypothetical protein
VGLRPRVQRIGSEVDGGARMRDGPVRVNVGPMNSGSKRLRIPAQIRAVMIGSVAVFACSSTSSTAPRDDGGTLAETSTKSDAGRDASFDGGPCKITVPTGRVCETTCYSIYTDPISPYACQVTCAPPEKDGPGTCTCNGGGEPEGGSGFCPGGLNCELEAYADGGTQVLC